jgi:hypothetical protein
MIEQSPLPEVPDTERPIPDSLLAYDHLKDSWIQDPLLLFAYRRKIAKELGYDERGKLGTRKQLKALKWRQQQGKCAHCQQGLPLSYSELDRKNAEDG